VARLRGRGGGRPGGRGAGRNNGRRCLFFFEKRKQDSIHRIVDTGDQRHDHNCGDQPFEEFEADAHCCPASTGPPPQPGERGSAEPAVAAVGLVQPPALPTHDAFRLQLARLHAACHSTGKRPCTDRRMHPTVMPSVRGQRPPVYSAPDDGDVERPIQQVVAQTPWPRFAPQPRGAGLLVSCVPAYWLRLFPRR